MTETTTPNWTTDEAGGFPLDIHNPEGKLRLRVVPGGESSHEADQCLAVHVAAMLSRDTTDGAITVVFGADESRITSTFQSGDKELTMQLLRRIKVLLEKADGMSTEDLEAMPGTILDLGLEVLKYSNSKILCDKLIQHANDEEKWAELRHHFMASKAAIKPH